MKGRTQSSVPTNACSYILTVPIKPLEFRTDGKNGYIETHVNQN